MGLIKEIAGCVPRLRYKSGNDKGPQRQWHGAVCVIIAPCVSSSANKCHYRAECVIIGLDPIIPIGKEIAVSSTAMTAT